MTKQTKAINYWLISNNNKIKNFLPNRVTKIINQIVVCNWMFLKSCNKICVRKVSFIASWSLMQFSTHNTISENLKNSLRRQNCHEWVYRVNVNRKRARAVYAFLVWCENVTSYEARDSTTRRGERCFQLEKK